MLISNEQLEQILSIYKPEYRMLRTAEVGEAYARATFFVSDNSFMQNPIGHVTGVQTQLCLTQLMYAAGSVWAEQEKFGRVVSFEEYLQLMAENVLFVEATTRFSSQIQPNTLFDGELSEVTMTNGGGLYIMYSPFRFGYFASSKRLVREAFKGDIKFIFRESASTII